MGVRNFAITHTPNGGAHEAETDAPTQWTFFPSQESLAALREQALGQAIWHTPGTTLPLGCIGGRCLVDGNACQPFHDWQDVDIGRFEPRSRTPYEHYDKVLRDASQFGRLRRRKGVAFFLKLARQRQKPPQVSLNESHGMPRSDIPHYRGDCVGLR